ncbi:MAG TPA: hypothetical protein VHS56_07270 [Candidatus Cybelea sp.]|jgi:hypothetical protein|nr:hypothetical protein [Candidatus Cybelea sp.]
MKTLVFPIIVFFGAALTASCAQSQYDAAPSNGIGQQPASDSMPALTTYASPGPGTNLTSTGGRAAERGWLSPAALSGQPLIYVADGQRVLIYPEENGGSPIGEITNGVTSAYGLCVDRYRNIYLTNWRNNTVEMYPHGGLNPSRIYKEHLRGPLYAVVDRRGNLFVGNGGGGEVIEFSAGSIKARRHAQSDGSEADGLDLDRHGNLYVAYRNSSGAGIDRFSPDLQHRENLGISLVQPQGLIVTHSGAIFVVETDYANALEKFLPGETKPELRLVPPNTLTELARTRVDKTLYASSLGGAVYSTGLPLGVDNSFNFVLSVGSSYSGVQGMALSNGQRF